MTVARHKKSSKYGVDKKEKMVNKSVEVQGSEDEEEEEDHETKFAQYLDSDEAEAESDDSGEDSDINSEEEARENEVDTSEKLLRKKMEKVPFSTLLRARKSMGEDPLQHSDSEEDEFEEERIKRREGEGKPGNKYQDLEKRDNKHAPTEISSRKPVPRRRIVVETQSKISRRDPRFSSLSASMSNAGLFQQSYSFLREQQSSEVKELKKVYNQLKKQEDNHAGPKAKSDIAQRIRKEREEVEMALRRAEGLENERRKREREGEVIRREKKEIQDKVKQGGKQFYLKESAKKQLILKDKFDRLAGGKEDGDDGSSRRDLKRAIERRRKKNAAKERREMPLGGGGTPSNGIMITPKRRRISGEATMESSNSTRKRVRRG